MMIDSISCLVAHDGKLHRHFVTSDDIAAQDDLTNSKGDLFRRVIIRDPAPYKIWVRIKASSSCVTCTRRLQSIKWILSQYMRIDNASYIIIARFIDEEYTQPTDINYDDEILTHCKQKLSPALAEWIESNTHYDELNKYDPNTPAFDLVD